MGSQSVFTMSIRNIKSITLSTQDSLRYITVTPHYLIVKSTVKKKKP